MSDLEQAKYPVGRFARLTAPLDRTARQECIETIEQAPAQIRTLVERLGASDLERQYREDGWTIRQVVHHVPDSHVNAYVRFKLAITEDTPTIKPYDEQAWSELVDVQHVPVQVSLDLLTAVHVRWVSVLRGMSESDYLRAYNHPDMGIVPLYEALALYAWHCQHHTAHIQRALAR